MCPGVTSAGLASQRRKTALDASFHSMTLANGASLRLDHGPRCYWPWSASGLGGRVVVVVVEMAQVPERFDGLWGRDDPVKVYALLSLTPDNGRLRGEKIGNAICGQMRNHRLTMAFADPLCHKTKFPIVH